MTSRKTTRPPVSLHPLAPAYRFSAARHSARASANANAATRAAASAISGRNRPVSADAGIEVVQAIGMGYTNTNRSAPGYAETGYRAPAHTAPHRTPMFSPDTNQNA